MLRPYRRVASVALQDALVFRSEIVFRILLSLVQVAVQTAIWTAVLPGTGFGPMRLDQMICYVVASAAINDFLADRTVGKIEQRVRDGSIALDLLSPGNFLLLTAAEGVGRMLAASATVVVPFLFIATLLFSPAMPSPASLPSFFVTLLLGVTIHLLLSMVVGMLSLWYHEVWQIDRARSAAMWLLSGAWIPLWYFPPPADFLLQALPFHLVFFVPLSYLATGTGALPLGTAIAMQLGWIVGLTLLLTYMWRAAITKITIQGG